MEENLNRFVKKAGSFVLASTLLFGAPFYFNTSRTEAAVSEERGKELQAELKDLIDKVNEHYYEDVDTNQILGEVFSEAEDKTGVDTVSKLFVSKLRDPYSEYYTLKELESFNSAMKGEYYGIGVEVSKDVKTGGIKIARVFEGSPAGKAKLKKGDIILKVGKKDITRLDMSKATTLLKGKKGSKVSLTILRGKSTKKIVVERNEVIIPTVSSKTYNKGRIGYVKVTAFLDNTAKEFVKALDKFEKRQIEGVVIDLRDNGGGYVGTAYDMLDRILPDSTEIFSFVYKSGKKDVAKTGEITGKSDKVFMVPIVILLNTSTASASELFTGALVDNGYAETVGETSYGKGVAQSIFDIQGKDAKGVIGGLKLTTIKYYLPNGESINKVGITPDYKIADNKKTAKDEQLDLAIKKIKEMID
jgi:peptidase, S41 family